METEVKNITFKHLEDNYKDCFPVHVCLRYVDYRDDLSNSMSLISEAVAKNDFLDLENGILENWDTWESEREYFNDFVKSVVRKHNPEDDGLEDYELEGILLNDDDIYEQFREYLWDKDESGDVVKQLMDRTNDPGCFYDLSFNMYGEPWCMSEKEIVADMKYIAKLLQLDWNEKSVRDALYTLRINATYGGSLRIYFNMPIWDLVSGDANGCKYGREPSDKFDYSTIKFDGKFMVGIIDAYNGSGMVHDIKLNASYTFNRDNLYLSECTQYSYEDIFGAYSDYNVDSPDFLFEQQEGQVEIETNKSLKAHNEREAHYDEVFKAGGCTYGDMNYKRHRNIVYENNPPMCGSRCKDCGTFWID